MIKQYQETSQGMYQLDGTAFGDTHDFYKRMEAEVAAGEAVILPYSTPVLTREQVDNVRKDAYQKRSDPLYMQWQYDQTPAAEQLWRAEVDAIKQEHPWPA